MPQQLTFDWPIGIALGAQDFFVSAANDHAYAMLSVPGSWPGGKLALCGPKGCGKSHLVRIFAARNDCTLLQANELPAELPRSGTVVIENIDQLPPDRQEAIFHLHNNIMASGGLLLMTARSAPARWPLSLPDLASRMQATTVATVDDPDDALLQALIMKLFADRQINPPPTLVRYLATRIERSFAAAADIVARMDTAALTEKKPVSLRLAAGLLDN